LTRSSPVSLLLVAALCLSGVLSLAQPVERPRRAVEILDLDTLREDLFSRSLRDLRPLEDYLEGHIPGSHHLDWHPLEEAVLASPGPAMDKVAEALGDAQLMPGQVVALYDTSLIGRADGWVAWLLAYGGVDPVEVFDGGFAAWNRHRRLGVYSGHSMPQGRRTLQANHIDPRPDLRVDPAVLAEGVPEGSALLVVVPEGEGEPAAGHVRASEVLDSKGLFLYPYHLRLLLESRAVDPEARLLIEGEHLDGGLVWTALVANGFQAAMVVPLTEDTAAKQVP
jgi:rhodanese-related sulfurtransferase